MEPAKKSRTEGEVRLGLRKQSKEFSNNKKVMLMCHPQPRPQPQPSSLQLQGSPCFWSSDGGGDDVVNNGPSSRIGLGVGGSFFCSTRNHFVTTSLSHICSSSNNNNTVSALPTTLTMQPPSYSSFSPSSGEMAPYENVRVPYTMGQWKEMERQAMIYNSMMSSVPVPPELLLPIAPTPSNSISAQSNSSGEIGVSSNGSMDPEPWRCKRTDGKKWRCSRDVAPDQKYCERHSHKSRPRSRKPVELHANSSTQSTNYVQKTHSLYQTSCFPDQSKGHLSVLSAALSSAHEQPRSSTNWFLTGETVPDTSSSWQYMKMDNSNELLSTFQDQFNTNSYSFGGGQSWQAPQLNEGSVNPTLTLTMYDGGRGYGEGNVNAMNGYGIRGVDDESVTWTRSTPGGPLAEALCLGISSGDAKGDSDSGSFGVRDCETT